MGGVKASPQPTTCCETCRANIEFLRFDWKEREREREIYHRFELILSIQSSKIRLKISLFNCKKFEYENRRSLDANQGNSVKRRIAQGCSISFSLFFFFKYIHSLHKLRIEYFVKHRVAPILEHNFSPSRPRILGATPLVLLRAPVD